MNLFKSRKKGYAAFLVCGLCAALNVLAYLPRQTFEEAEATEFTVTLLLVVVFLVFGILGIVLAIKNARDSLLLALMLATVSFTLTINLSGAWKSSMRVGLELAYAVFAIALGTLGLLLVSRKTG